MNHIIAVHEDQPLERLCLVGSQKAATCTELIVAKAPIAINATAAAAAPSKRTSLLIDYTKSRAVATSEQGTTGNFRDMGASSCHQRKGRTLAPKPRRGIPRRAMSLETAIETTVSLLSIPMEGDPKQLCMVENAKVEEIIQAQSQEEKRRRHTMGTRLSTIQSLQIATSGFEMSASDMGTSSADFLDKSNLLSTSESSASIELTGDGKRLSIRKNHCRRRRPTLTDKSNTNHNEIESVYDDDDDHSESSSSSSSSSGSSSSSSSSSSNNSASSSPSAKSIDLMGDSSSITNLSIPSFATFGRDVKKPYINWNHNALATTKTFGSRRHLPSQKNVSFKLKKSSLHSHNYIGEGGETAEQILAKAQAMWSEDSVVDLDMEKEESGSDDDSKGDDDQKGKGEPKDDNKNDTSEDKELLESAVTKAAHSLALEASMAAEADMGRREMIAQAAAKAAAEAGGNLTKKERRPSDSAPIATIMPPLLTAAIPTSKEPKNNTTNDAVDSLSASTKAVTMTSPKPTSSDGAGQSSLSSSNKPVTKVDRRAMFAQVGKRISLGCIKMMDEGADGKAPKVVTRGGSCRDLMRTMQAEDASGAGAKAKGKMPATIDRRTLKAQFGHRKMSNLTDDIQQSHSFGMSKSSVTSFATYQGSSPKPPMDRRSQFSQAGRKHQSMGNVMGANKASQGRIAKANKARDVIASILDESNQDNNKLGMADESNTAKNRRGLRRSYTSNDAEMEESSRMGYRVDSSRRSLLAGARRKLMVDNSGASSRKSMADSRRRRTSATENNGMDESGAMSIRSKNVSFHSAHSSLKPVSDHIPSSTHSCSFHTAATTITLDDSSGYSSFMGSSSLMGDFSKESDSSSNNADLIDCIPSANNNKTAGDHRRKLATSKSTSSLRTPPSSRRNVADGPSSRRNVMTRSKSNSKRNLMSESSKRNLMSGSIRSVSSRRNVMQDTTDTSHFVTGSRIRRIEHAGDLSGAQFLTNRK